MLNGMSMAGPTAVALGLVRLLPKVVKAMVESTNSIHARVLKYLLPSKMHACLQLGPKLRHATHCTP